MNERLITPPFYPEIEELKLSSRLIYLAGPVRGAKDWQTEAYGIIHAMDPKLWVLSPRRIEPPQQRYSPKKSAQQDKWETFWLNKIIKNHGVAMFWLAKEVEHICTRAFAQTTRDEVAKFRTLVSLDQFRGLVVGIEDGYSGASYQRRKLLQEAPNVVVHKKFKNTCEEAVWLATRNWAKLDRAYPIHYK